MDLAINQTWGKLGIDFKIPRIEINEQSASLSIDQVLPEIGISGGQAHIKIDQTKCFEDTGVITTGQMVAKYAAKGKSDAAAGAATTVQEGEMLADPDSGYTVAKMAYSHMFTVRKFGLAAIPRHMPEISVKEDPMKVSLRKGNLNIQAQMGQVDIRSEYEKVQTYWLQQPFIEIVYTGEWIV